MMYALSRTIPTHKLLRQVKINTKHTYVQREISKLKELLYPQCIIYVYESHVLVVGYKSCYNGSIYSPRAIGARYGPPVLNV